MRQNEFRRRGRSHKLHLDLHHGVFGPLGVTNIRTFVDRENPTRVPVLMDVPTWTPVEHCWLGTRAVNAGWFTRTAFRWIRTEEPDLGLHQSHVEVANPEGGQLASSDLSSPLSS